MNKDLAEIYLLYADSLDKQASILEKRAADPQGVATNVETQAGAGLRGYWDGLDSETQRVLKNTGIGAGVGGLGMGAWSLLSNRDWGDVAKDALFGTVAGAGTGAGLSYLTKAVDQFKKTHEGSAKEDEKGWSKAQNKGVGAAQTAGGGALAYYGGKNLVRGIKEWKGTTPEQNELRRAVVDTRADADEAEANVGDYDRRERAYYDAVDLYNKKVYDALADVKRMQGKNRNAAAATLQRVLRTARDAGVDIGRLPVGANPKDTAEFLKVLDADPSIMTEIRKKLEAAGSRLKPETRKRLQESLDLAERYRTTAQNAEHYGTPYGPGEAPGKRTWRNLPGRATRNIKSRARAVGGGAGAAVGAYNAAKGLWRLLSSPDEEQK